MHDLDKKIRTQYSWSKIASSLNTHQSASEHSKTTESRFPFFSKYSTRSLNSLEENPWPEGIFPGAWFVLFAIWLSGTFVEALDCMQSLSCESGMFRGDAWAEYRAEVEPKWEVHSWSLCRHVLRRPSVIPGVVVAAVFWCSRLRWWRAPALQYLDRGECVDLAHAENCQWALVYCVIHVVSYFFF